MFFWGRGLCVVGRCAVDEQKHEGLRRRQKEGKRDSRQEAGSRHEPSSTESATFVGAGFSAGVHDVDQCLCIDALVGHEEDRAGLGTHAKFDFGLHSKRARGLCVNRDLPLSADGHANNLSGLGSGA